MDISSIQNALQLVGKFNRQSKDCGVRLGFLVKFLQEISEGHFKYEVEFSTHDLVEQYIRPAVKQQQCRFVDLIPPHHVGPASIFVSHRWQGSFSELITTLCKHLNFGEDAEAANNFLWLDVFAVNQNTGTLANKVDVDSFEETLRQTSITLFKLDEQGTALRRVWCLYELWKTFVHRGAETLQVMSYDVEWTRLKEVFYGVDVEAAEAFHQSDKETILSDIKADIGFQNFNELLRDALVDSTSRQAQAADVNDENARIDAQLTSSTMLCEAGRYEEGEQAAREALLVAEGAKGPEALKLIGRCLNQMSNLLKEQGKFQEAIPHQERAVAVGREVLGEEHPTVASRLISLADMTSAEGRYLDARLAYEQAIDILLRVHGEEHMHVALGLNSLANLLDAHGQYEEALGQAKRALLIREKLYQEFHPELAESLQTLGVIYHHLQDNGAGQECLERSINVFSKTLGPAHPKTVKVRESFKT
ncbi:hypothetical protein CYMTET_4744 [Cymbomonas tetramitiformis]|uniref:Uncharacterized protein n=1 Tax=Cymbomonas tetramitiformis TaxID=36881 RepID=A0AAE0H0S3_9CHLO|nr:hypothetical protein CYMTET_4744 [Cymbomonas tetramitiformis]